MVLGEKTDPVSRVLRGMQGKDTDVTCLGARVHSRALPYPQSRVSSGMPSFLGVLRGFAPWEETAR